MASEAARFSRRSSLWRVLPARPCCGVLKVGAQRDPRSARRRGGWRKSRPPLREPRACPHTDTDPESDTGETPDAPRTWPARRRCSVPRRVGRQGAAVVPFSGHSGGDVRTPSVQRCRRQPATSRSLTRLRRQSRLDPAARPVSPTPPSGQPTNRPATGLTATQRSRFSRFRGGPLRVFDKQP
jgi:hypothetical protein